MEYSLEPRRRFPVARAVALGMVLVVLAAAALTAWRRFNPTVPDTHIASRQTYSGPAAPFAAAEDWPTRPVTMVVPYAAGGGLDVLARTLAVHLSQSLGKQIGRAHV